MDIASQKYFVLISGRWFQASSLDSNNGVYLVPAFTGLGAPHWDPDARGAILGITRSTGVAHIARAALEAVCYQTRDLFKAMAEDGLRPQTLRVDGGMVANDWMTQFLADVLGITRQTAVLAFQFGHQRCGGGSAFQQKHLQVMAQPGFDLQRRRRAEKPRLFSLGSALQDPGRNLRGRLGLIWRLRESLW